jgi:hypothetical protein
MFRALLAHPQEALHKRHLVYCVRVMSVGCSQDWSGAIALSVCLLQQRLLWIFFIFIIIYIEGPKVRQISPRPLPSTSLEFSIHQSSRYPTLCIQARDSVIK